MKIAFDAQSLLEENKTGIGWTVERLISHIELQKNNQYQLNYFAFIHQKRKHDLMQGYVSKGYTLKSCGWFPLGVYRRLWNHLPIPYSLFMGGDADVTQFFNYVVPPGVKGKSAVYIYDMVYKACPETMEEITRKYMEENVEKSCQRADAIITISEFSKREIIKYLGIPKEKIWVVPCGVDLDRFHPDYATEDIRAVKKRYNIGGDYFLYLGTLEPRKNIPAILLAYRRLKEERNDPIPDLVLAGKKGWGYDQIFSLVQKYGLEQNVVFTGYVSEEDKPLLLSGAICFLFPSLYEGFGIPPLEAMACGTPAIVSDQASLPEVVGEGALIVGTEETDRMAAGMEKLWSDQEFRQDMSKKAWERAKGYSWDRAAETLQRVYTRL